MTALTRPRQNRRLVRLLTGFLLLIVVGYFGISAFITSELTLTKRRSIVANPVADGLNVEDVAFRSGRDDVELRGWLLKAADDQGRIVVMVHGHNAARDDSSNGMYPVAWGYVERNISVLMFDLRGCGESEGERFSLAWFEQADVRGAVRFAQERGFQHIGLHGYSMGAASALLAAAADPAVDALVTDSSYADLMDVLNREVPRRSGLPGIFTPGIVLMSRLMYGIHATEVKPAEAAAQFAPRPLLVIHGADDGLIPANDSERIWQARYGAGERDSATYYLVAGADHTQGFNTNKALYLAKVGDFFTQHLK